MLRLLLFSFHWKSADSPCVAEVAESDVGEVRLPDGGGTGRPTSKGTRWKMENTENTFLKLFKRFIFVLTFLILFPIIVD